MDALGRLEDLPQAYRDELTALNLVPLWPSLRALLPHMAQRNCPRVRGGAPGCSFRASDRRCSALSLLPSSTAWRTCRSSWRRRAFSAAASQLACLSTAANAAVVRASMVTQRSAGTRN